MSAIDSARAQHAELRAIAVQVLAALDRGEPAAAAAVHEGLARLIGKLTVHLAAEDRHIYPVLRRHPDPQVRSAAERVSRELGGLAAAVEAYRAEWPAVSKGGRLPEAFIRRTRLILAALEQRIQREEEELFALLPAG
ncbi:MAG: hemerythrin domain-containing protein [Deferrisomatales bacterium]